MHWSEVMTRNIPFTAILGRLCVDEEYKRVDLMYTERQV